MTMAATKKARKAVVNGTEHTDASLAAMKTTEIAGLVAAIRGDGKTPKPATKAKAIELFWQAAERLPKTSETPKAPEVQDAKAAAPGAKKDAQGSDNGTPEKAPKGKRYAIEVDGPEKLAKVQVMNPVARRLAEEIRAAGRPLSMAECAAIVGKFSKSKKPEKLVAWHFCKLYRPAGILVESRDGGGA
jgi:hypothetical protein